MEKAGAVWRLNSSLQYDYSKNYKLCTFSEIEFYGMPTLRAKDPQIMSECQLCYLPRDIWVLES